MNEKQIVLVSLVLALLGIACLFYLAYTMKPKSMSLSEINSGKVGEYAEVFGFVRSASERNGNVFIKICEGEDCLSVVIFERTARRMGNVNVYLLAKGDRILVRGVIQEYKGSLELIVDESDGITLA